MSDLPPIVHPVKQSHNVIYLEATDLLVTRKPNGDRHLIHQNVNI